jgi:PPM family protein phosphatase
MKFSVFQVSRRGGRDKNEDRMGYCYTRESGLFVLADGMGGHPEGEVASQMALQTVSALFQKQARPVLDDPAEFLAKALLAAHQALIRYAATKGMLDTPRTTLVAAVMQEGRAYWVHCGDSRLYLVRDGQLQARTRDHSYLEHRAALKVADDMVNRNILFTCLGSPTRPVFDVAGPVPLQQGDRVLLCSDGLWSALDDVQIVQQLAAAPVANSAPEMVELALREAGSTSDNVTVLALEWETPDSSQSTRDVSTEFMHDDVFASTIQAAMVDPTLVEDLDDAAIERSIAEINEAIRRTAARKSS